MELEKALRVTKELLQDQSAIISDLSAEAQEEILEALNSIRRNVTPPASNMLKMKWSKKASENAKKWVSQCRFRNSPQEARTTSDFACGESLAQIKIAMSWSKVIATWISTKTYFKYGIGPTDPKKNIYTYTQIVWYNSHMVGCALAYCPQNTFSFMYACHFCPGGNNQEKITTPYKEGPSCADCPQHCEDKLCTNPCKYTNKHYACEAMHKTFKCDESFMYDLCQATCECSTDIV
ncbi:serotriflin-like [Varanus komodoensis]|uniref:serotriflin-like n=1 Tax=Varanus komodoensis TaxID=61221 RepID=UPI001CF7DF29|nr:serotriflin-like [Varanus komodoensis]